MVFLPLHTPILEPDLDLALGEAEGVSDLDASPSGQVAVEVELLLQLQDLLSGVGSARPLGLPSIVIGIDRAHMDLLHPGVDHRLLPLQPGQALVGQQRAAGPGAGRGSGGRFAAALQGMAWEQGLGRTGVALGGRRGRGARGRLLGARGGAAGTAVAVGRLGVGWSLRRVERLGRRPRRPWRRCRSLVARFPARPREVLGQRRARVRGVQAAVLEA